MSSRRSLDELPTRYSLLDGLPAIYRSERFLTDLVTGFDAVLAPIHATIEDLHAYLDPDLAPPDFLEWLGGWLGLVVNQRWPVHRRREFVAQAVDVYRWRGTREGIERAVELYTGVRPTVEENGGVAGSWEPVGPLPGERRLRLHVEVRTDDASIEEALVDAIVASVKPAHVPHTVAVTFRR